ncbi:rRNA maturation RNase YbeY [Patescibacteria group bacterium]|nr:rRNA maturation RNase YbeY [Patescibacteria group bacterium]MBU1683222.1 rRNA maturation RNase YbeY [Patescibacteria group bacterium]MBU1935751.1 rRNA maturation RNase YbeY [Patescibacteria group bacterium]
MTIEFINDKEWGIETDVFTSTIERSEGVIDLSEGILNVVFVTDAYIKALNKSYRDKDEPTDVLSFNYQEGESGAYADLVGEIYISVETAKKQAKENKCSLEDELIKLFTHGLLHIHGYDHIKDEDFKAMAALEKKILY